MERNSFVYEHWRPDKDICFYVGRGRKRRPTDMIGRSDHHKRIQAKLARKGLCVEVRLVAGGLTHDESVALEIERIAFWRSVGVPIINRTAGGEGALDPVPETRAKMRAAKLGGTLTDEHKAKIAASTKAALLAPGMHEKLSSAIRASHARAEVKEKLSRHQRTRVRSKEQYEKTAAKLRGRKLSPEHAAKARMASVGRKQPQEEIERRRASNTGRKRSPESVQRMKDACTPERMAARVAKAIARPTTAASGFKGVKAHRNGWVARIKRDGKEKHLGCFRTPEEANEAVLAAARRYDTEGAL